MEADISGGNNSTYDPCDLNPPSYPDFGNQLFIPQENSEILEVKVNYWIVTHPFFYDGSNPTFDNTHFTADSNDPDFQNQQDYLKSLLSFANSNVYGNEGEPEICLDGMASNAPSSIDSKIRLVLNKKPNGDDAIYYRTTDFLSASQNSDRAFEYFIEPNYPVFEDALNVIFVQDDVLQPASGWGPGTNNPDLAHVRINKAYGRYLSWLNPNNNENWKAIEGQNIAHELNHVLGLHHTNLSSADIFELECEYEESDVDFNMALNHNMTPGGKNQRYLSPLQVGHIRRHLLTSFQSRFLKKLPSEREVYPIPFSTTIEENESIVWHGDIVVGAGIILTIKGELILADDSRIFVEREGKLILDGGLITSCAENSQWRGILVEGGDKSIAFPQLAHPRDDVYPGVAGTVVLKNQARIENARNGISTDNRHYGWPAVKDYWGGLIYTASGSEFVNCKRAVEIMKYGNQNIKDNSKFINTTITNCKDGITIWESDGVSIENCTFEEIQNTGIITYDAQTEIENGNNFKNMFSGIKVFNTRMLDFEQKIGNIDVAKNSFMDIDYVAIDLYNAFNVEKTTIENNDIINTGTWEGRGIYVLGNGNYEIRNNDVEKTLRGIELFESSNSSNANFIRNNSTDFNHLGIRIDYNNEGVQITENCFSDLFVGISISTTGVLSQQGNLEEEAANCIDMIINGTEEIFNYNTNEDLLYYVYELRPDTDCERPTRIGSGIMDAGKVEILDSEILSAIGECGTFNIVSNPPISLSCNLPGSIVGLMDYISEIENNGLNEFNEKCYRKAMNTLYSKVLKDNKVIDGINFYSNLSEFNDKIYALNLMLETESFENGLAFINSNTSENGTQQNYLEAQKIYINFRKNGLNYELSESDYNFLKFEAVNSKEYVGVMASVFGLITGESIVFPIGDENEMDEGLPEFRKSVKSEIAIFPNPTSDRVVNIQGTDFGNGQNVSIYSPTGRLVLQKPIENGILQLTNLNAGLYFVELEIENEKSIHKLILN